MTSFKSASAVFVRTIVVFRAQFSHQIAVFKATFGGGLFGDVNANATIDGTSTANVTIDGGGTVIDGIYGVTIKADQNNFSANPSRDSSAFIGIGPTLGSADNNTVLSESVNGLAGSTIIAGPPSESNSQALFVEATANGGGGGSERPRRHVVHGRHHLPGREPLADRRRRGR